VLAHGSAIGPHDLLTAWRPNAPVVVLIVTAALLYWHGCRDARQRPTDGRRRAFTYAGFAALAVALISPLDTASGSLASAHMVQHLLMTTVAVPLLAFGHPARTMMRVLPRATHVLFRRQQVLVRSVGRRALRHPIGLALLHGFVMWFWHASGPYNAALGNEAVHALGHATMFVTAFAFWAAVASRSNFDIGVRLLATFALALQTTFLSALITFARVPWYSGHGDATQAWGFDALQDQQLAGVIMWVPGGAVFVIVALSLTTRWLRSMA
jgi:putative membrane protein